MQYTLLLGLAAFIASALGGALGMASGIFIVPILTLVFRVDIRIAIGASLVSVIACSCGSAGPFLRARLTNIRLAVVLETATTAGALTGVLFIGIIPVTWLYALFAAILAVSAYQMLARRREAVTTLPPDTASWATRLRLHNRFPDPESGSVIDYNVARLPIGMALMYGAGLISALLGIGSGVLKIPAMDSALQLPLRVSSATSSFMIGVTAAASAGAYFALGRIDVAVTGPVALGSVLGALAGARLLMGMSSARLRLFFVVVLLLLAIQMLLTAFGVTVRVGRG